MKRTLLSMVQNILSDMDSEDVNSIADSLEALQVASVIEDTYYLLVSSKMIPEHKELLKLDALSNSEFPTHMKYPENVKEIQELWYNTGTTTDYKYREIPYCEPLDFLNKLDNSSKDSNKQINDVNGGTVYYVGTDTDPSFYTSFDDDHVVFNSYDKTKDDTVQEYKVRAYGTIYPVFNQTDNFEPDIDDTLRPLLLAEAKSTCFSLYKAGSDPKIEQAARRQKNFVQNDMFKTRKENKTTNYGRR